MTFRKKKATKEKGKNFLSRNAGSRRSIKSGEKRKRRVLCNLIGATVKRRGSARGEKNLLEKH